MDVLIVTQEEKKNVGKYYKLNETQIAEYVEIIKIWKTKQPHLQLDISDDFIEKILLRNKFQIERTKQKLDNYFSIRGSNKDFMENLETIVPSKETVAYLPTTRMTPKLERIVIWKLLNTNPDAFDVEQMVKAQMSIDELRLRHDYAIGTRYCVDTKGFSLKHLVKINPLLLRRALWFEEKVYSNRILGIHFLNFPQFVSKVMAILKVILKPKIYDRIVIHENLESLHEVIPRHCLPMEYGGNESTVPNLLEKWDDLIRKNYDFFLKNYENIAREELRPKQIQAGNDAFGVDGTFKKLSID